MEWCLEGGFEVPGWISENLVDILILGQGLTEIPKLEEFRWMLEEQRVSLFAQELKTPHPVSYKRLAKAWAALS